MPAAPTLVKTTYREAVRAAMKEALERDDRVFLMGEDVGAYGGCYAVSLGLLEAFGPERIRDTPLSESAFVATISRRVWLNSTSSSSACRVPIALGWD